MSRDRSPQPYKEGQRHGTTSGYSNGCRCDLCRAAAREHSARYRSRGKRPTPTPTPVPFGPLLERVASYVGCAAEQLTDEQIAEACGVARKTALRWRHTGLVRHIDTDRVSIALGWHPAAIWGMDWYITSTLGRAA